MEVTQSALSVLFTQAEVKFGEALSTVEQWTPELASIMPSSSVQNIYAWMDRLPILRQWLGNRVINAVSTQARTVVNLPFEFTDALLKEDVMNDNFGLFNMNLKFMAMQAAKWSDQQIANYIINNAAATAAAPVNGYDGVPFFSTAHPTLGGGVAGSVPSGVGATQSNLFVSTPLTYENYRIVRANMLNLKGKDGQPLYNKPDLLVCGPTLEGVARNIVESDFVAGVNGVTTANQTNVLKGTTSVKVIQELSSMPNAWFLLCTKNVVKPFIWQLRQAPMFSQLTNPTDLPVFMARQFLYGVEAWGAPAESLWFLAAAATSAATYNG
jgi:phage major head subunit gpT-like protein